MITGFHGTSIGILQSVFIFFPLPGLPQPAESPHNGGPGNCTAGDGHLDASCACPHGRWSPDVDPLDSQNHSGGGTHRTTACPHTTSHCAALQGEQIVKKTQN